MHVLRRAVGGNGVPRTALRGANLRGADMRCNSACHTALGERGVHRPECRDRQRAVPPVIGGREHPLRLGAQEAVVLAHRRAQPRGGALGNPAARRLFQKRHHPVTQAVAGAVIGQVGAVGDVGQPPRPAGIQNILPCRGQQGAEQEPARHGAHRRDAGKPVRPAPAQKTQEQCFQLVVRVVRRQQERDAACLHDAGEERIPRQPRLQLKTAPGAGGARRDVRPLADIRNAVRGGDSAAECLVPVGFRAADAVVQVRRRDGCAVCPRPVNRQLQQEA